MRIDILTIFPEIFSRVLNESIIKRAREMKKVEIVVHNIRDHASDAHKTVDDSPYGGGPGMVMKPDVLGRAFKAVPVPVKEGKRLVVLMSAAGEKLTQEVAKNLAGIDQLVLICGRYEGVDERFIELFVDREISIGDYVLSGGEIPAMVVCDSLIRLIPGVLGNEESLTSESHADGLLEYPQYTRPALFEGLKVPEVLTTGDHKKIEKWRHEESLRRTKERRPDLMRKI